MDPLMLIVMLIITIIAYLLVPMIITIFMKKPLQRKAVIAISILNSVVIWAIFQFVHVFIFYDGGKANIVAAILWGNIAYQILKARSTKLLNIKNDLYIPRRHVDKPYIIIGIISSLFLVIVAAGTLFSTNPEKSGTTSHSKGGVEGTWVYRTDGKIVSTFTYHEDGTFSYSGGTSISLIGDYKYVKSADEIVLYYDGKQKVISALIEKDLLRIQMNEDDDAMYYSYASE